eukprot:6211899-Pleurochrysis_carterae.AAC.1
MRLPLGALQAAPEFLEVVELEKERAIGQARTIVWRPAEAYHRQAMARRYSSASRQRSKLVMAMSLPRLETSVAKMPKLMRSRSASLRDSSLADSFLSRVKDLRRSLAGGLPSHCITRSCPAYA